MNLNQHQPLIMRQFTTEYSGTLVNNQRDGVGCETWLEQRSSNHQEYTGNFLRDALHGQGKYVWGENSTENVYTGSFYSSSIEGYGRFEQANGEVFEGLHKNNSRFGPGVVTHDDSSQTVGVWYGKNLIRLCQVIKPEWIPRIATTPVGKITLLRYKKLVKICNLEVDTARRLLNSIDASEEVMEKYDVLYNKCIRNPQSLFFNKTLFDAEFFSVKDCYIEVAVAPDEILHNESDLRRDQERTMNIKRLQNELEDLENVIVSLIKESSGDDILSSTSDETVPHDQDRHELLCIKRDKLALTLALEQSKPRTKNVLVTDLLAWNNEELLIEIMKHTFLHRKFEKNMPYVVSNILIGNRLGFNDISSYEMDCNQFLASCSDGRLRKASELLLLHNLNPDMCDGMGNTGVMYAAARDRRQTIRGLVDFGANLDVYNDECLTPLSMCILRYLAVQNNVSNWEAAFLKPLFVEESEMPQWRVHQSLVSVADNQKSRQSLYRISSNNLRPYDISDLITLTESRNDLLSTCTILKQSSESKNLQERYWQSGENQPFLLSTECIKPLVINNQKQQINKNDKSKKNANAAKQSKKQQSSKKDQIKKSPIIEEVEEIDNKARYLAEVQRNERLNSIRLTITTLLDCGANPNEGEVPMPILLTALFTKNLDLVKELLSHNANPNSRTIYEELTGIHILASVQPWDGLIEMVKLLLKYSANPNLKASTVHWPEEKEILVAERELVQLEEGKTPLHLLAMRYDFNTDALDTIPILAQTLIASKARASEYYLGHTPLSLAILRGNIKLVKALLETGKVDPNQMLGEDMGVALAVFMLKRYPEIPPYDVCDQIIQTLVYYGANPFNPTGRCGNLIELIAEEFPEGTIKSSKKQLKVPKKGKESTRQKLKTLIDNIASFVLDKHIKGWVVRELYKGLEAKNFDVEVSKSMAKYVPVAEMVDIAQALFYRGAIKVDREKNSKTLYKLMEFIASANSESNFNIKKALANFDYRKLPPKAGYLNLPQPQVEKHSEKYDVCYYCHKKRNRLLFRCPTCKIVYFCSETCNILSNEREKWGHPCKTVFYNDELEKWKMRQAKGKGALAFSEKSSQTAKTDKKTRVKKSTTKQDKDKAGGEKKGEKENREDDGGLDGDGKPKHRLPITFPCFLEKVAKYWPELDLSTLFLPYACYNEGQLYYRFDFQDVIFGETYSFE